MSQPRADNPENVSLDAIQEDLVAYLDGELSAEEAARIERLMEQDARVRQEVQRLAETWEWLDVLERPTVDEDFTRTTVEMVAQSAASEVVALSRSRTRSFWLIAALGLVGAAVAFFVGLRGAGLFWQNPNQWLLDHYAVIENQDYYRHIENLAFLRLLRDNGIFIDDEQILLPKDAVAVDEWFSFGPKEGPPAAGPGGAPRGPQKEKGPFGFGGGSAPGQPTSPSGSAPPEPSAGNGFSLLMPGNESLPLAVRASQNAADDKQSPTAADVSQPDAGGTSATTLELTRRAEPSAGAVRLVTLSDPREIRRRIAAMSDAEKAELWQKVERFRRLSPAEQERLQQIHQELMAAPDREQLMTVLQRYYQWFKLLTPSQRGELEALKPEQRIAWIRRTRSEMIVAAINRTLFSFPPERLRKLLQDSMLVRPEDRPAPEDIFGLIRFVENSAARRGEELLNKLSQGEREDVVKKLSQLADPQQRQEFLAITWLQWQLDHPDQSAPLTWGELEQLKKDLSADSRRRLDGLPRDEQLKLVSRWIRSYVFFRYVMPRVWADMRRPISEQELGRFLEEQLTKEEREALLALPPDEMQRELTRRYLRWRYPGFEGMGHWRGRGGERRPPRPGSEPPGREQNAPQRPPSSSQQRFLEDPSPAREQQAPGPPREAPQRQQATDHPEKSPT